MPHSPPRSALIGLLLVSCVVAASAAAAPGDYDLSFDGDGIVENAAHTGANTVLVQPDGKILALLDDQFGVLRYESDGSLDTAFGSGGLAATDFGSASEITTTGLLAPDGAIVLVGMTSPFTSSARLVLARFDPSGQLDPTFGTGGKTLTGIGDTYARFPTVTRLPSGRLIVGGGNWTGVDSYGLLVAFDEGGMLDPGFGSGGVLALLYPVFIAAVAPHGSDLLAVGSSTDYEVRLLRLNADATLGVVTTLVGPVAFPTALEVDAAGRILIAGGASSCDKTFVVRLLADDTPDPTFGMGGTVLLDVATTPSAACDEAATALALQPDGRILVAVESRYFVDPLVSSAFSSSRLLRLEFDGSLDTSFGSGGIVERAFTAPRALALQPDGKVVMGGSYAEPGDPVTVPLDYSLTLTRNEATGPRVCTAAPRSDCGAGSPRASTLKLSRRSGKMPRLQWSWKKGTTMPGDLGNPLNDGSYALCLYDGTNALVATAQVEGEGACGAKPCWRTSGSSGWQYQDKAAKAFGIAKVKLKSGVGSAAFGYQAKHANAPVVSLPLALPLRAQLQIATGACFDATYPTATRNDTSDFSAKN